MINKTVISVKNLHVYYNGTHAIKNISLDIPKGKITALIGASGSGKSSFLRVLNRIIDEIPLSRVEGTITAWNQNILDKKTDVISLRQKVGMLFQNPVPFPKSIYDNIAYGLEVKGLKKRSQPFWEKITHNPIDPHELEKSDNLIDQIVVSSLKEAVLWNEVKDRLHQSAHRLSGGQQQRLCIARAIALRPEVLLLDEPCSALDPISTKKIEQLLLKLKKDYTIVIVTHNLYQARRVSDKVAFFHLGKLIEFGTTNQMFNRPKAELTKDYVRGDFG